MYYSNGACYTQNGILNGVVKASALNSFGLTINNDTSTDSLTNMGLYVKRYSNGTVLISKDPFFYKDIFTRSWYYDLEKMF